MGSALLRRHPSAFLLAAQLISLMLYPAMDSSDTGRLLFGAVGVVVLALALWVVNRSPSVNWIAWLLAVPAVALTVGSVCSASRNGWCCRPCSSRCCTSTSPAA